MSVCVRARRKCSTPAFACACVRACVQSAANASVPILVLSRGRPHVSASKKYAFIIAPSPIPTPPVPRPPLLSLRDNLASQSKQRGGRRSFPPPPPPQTNTTRAIQRAQYIRHSSKQKHLLETIQEYLSPHPAACLHLTADKNVRICMDTSHKYAYGRRHGHRHTYQTG